MIGAEQISSGFDLLTLVGLVAAGAGAYTSVKLLGPNRKKVIAETADLHSAEADRLIGRYRELLLRADQQLVRQGEQLEALEIREDECEKRNEAARLEILEMREEISSLQATMHRHGLNGP